MSTLNVANITDGTDTVETGYVINGSAKAWVNFNGTGTVAIRDSLNVASITDSGTGRYSGNFSSSMSSGNYNAVCVGNNSGNAKDALIDASSLTTSAVSGLWQLAQVSFYDAAYGNFLVHGDLA